MDAIPYVRVHSLFEEKIFETNYSEVEVKSIQHLCITQTTLRLC